MKTNPISMAVTLTLAVACGCSQRVPYAPKQDHSKLAGTEFVHLVSQEPMVTYDEMCRIALLLADGEDKPMTFEERDQAVKSRGIARPEWRNEPNDVVNRGTVAHMILKAAKVRRGLNSVLAGWTGVGCERYALKDLTYEGIVPYGLPYQVPTGGEVMRAVSNADDYMAKNGTYASTEREIASPKDIQ